MNSPLDKRLDLRTLLSRLSLSQRGAAALLGTTDRSMRRWAAGEQPVPPAIAIALEAVAELSERTGEPPGAIMRRILT